MAKTDRRPLTAVEVKALIVTGEPGLKWIDDGLFLQDGRSFAHRYMLGGKPRLSGLGAVKDLTLAQARAARDDERAMIRKGIDPVAARRAGRTAAKTEQVKAITFRECAEGYIKAHEASWKNPVHRQQWRNTLDTYVYPIVGELPVAEVDTALAVRVLEPIWSRVPESASRIRGRCECIIDWAKAREYRTGENPFRWRGHLDKLFPAKAKVRRVEHHAAMPYSDVAGFVEKLREREGISARALEFLILTAARTGEVIGAKWDEINLATKVWTIPADRMKAGKEHRVPLSPASMTILDQMQAIRSGAIIFPGMRGALSNMSLLAVIERMGHADLTSHGFRSSFRDWCAECTNYPSEVCEAALAHAISNKVEAAYRRTDLFERRRRLMDDWAAYCTNPVTTGEVVQLRKG
jgi:integrase